MYELIRTPAFWYKIYNGYVVCEKERRVIRFLVREVLACFFYQKLLLLFAFSSYCPKLYVVKMFLNVTVCPLISLVRSQTKSRSRFHSGSTSLSLCKLVLSKSNTFYCHSQTLNVTCCLSTVIFSPELFNFC